MFLYYATINKNNNDDAFCFRPGYTGRRSRGSVARMARVVRARVRARQERVRHTGRSELRGRRGLGHQLHRGVRAAIRAGRRQTRQQPDPALSRRRGGKYIQNQIYIFVRNTVASTDLGPRPKWFLQVYLNLGPK